MSEETMTPEMVRERDELIARYGRAVFEQAIELSGLTLCLRALSEELDVDDTKRVAQREWLYRQASLHLAKLLEPLMPAGHSAKVTECAQRIESNTEQWMADEMAKKAGL